VVSECWQVYKLAGLQVLFTGYKFQVFLTSVLNLQLVNRTWQPLNLITFERYTYRLRSRRMFDPVKFGAKSEAWRTADCGLKKGHDKFVPL